MTFSWFLVLFHFPQYYHKACLDPFDKEYIESDLRAFTKYIIAQDISLDNNMLTCIHAKPFASYDFAQPMGESREKTAPSLPNCRTALAGNFEPLT